MFVAKTVAMWAVCWLLASNLCQSVIYRHKSFSVPCETVFNSSYTAFSRIECVTACKLAGCLFIQYTKDLCSMGGLGTIPTEVGITDALYVRTVLPSPLDEQPLSVVDKPAFSDMQWKSHYAHLAVDGSTEESSFFHAKTSITNAWWVLDLEAEYSLSEVEVQPTSIHKRFFRSMEVRVGKTFNSAEYLASKDFSSWQLVGFYEGPPATNDPVIFSCSSGAVGRYISVQRLNTGTKPYFTLTEVYVKIFVMP